jgi:hypothetical protein
MINLKSKSFEKSYADAWQDTFLSFGFSIIEYFQNVGVIGGKPIETKKSSAFFDIFLFFFLIRLKTI